MTYTLSKGQFPDPPRGGNNLENCFKDFKDFKDFKEKSGQNIIELLSQIVKNQEARGFPAVRVNEHKNALMDVNTLIKQGNERLAFSKFYQTFPRCMPYRRQPR